MNPTDQRRMVVLTHVASGALVNAEAAELLGISKRQLQRLRRAYSESGVTGLVHGNRGRVAHNSVDTAIAARVVEMGRELTTLAVSTRIRTESHAASSDRWRAR